MDSKIIYHFIQVADKQKSRLLNVINVLDEGSYLFIVTIFFYVILLLTNLSNLGIVASFFLMFLLFQLKLKNFKLSLFYTDISSLIIFSGKSYPIQLLPIGFFPEAIFPQGYFVYLIVTPSHVISFFLFVLIIGELFRGKLNLKDNFRLSFADFLIILFFVFKIFSALLASKNPQLSFAYEALSLNSLVLYVYARLFIKPNEQTWKNLVFLLCSLVLFEAVLSVPETISKSPLSKNLEFQVNIAYFGNAVDESLFTFRPVGTFDHANTLGVWLASTLIFIFPFIKKINSSIVWFSFFSGIAILATTLSRTAWLGFFVALLFFVVFDRERFRTITKYVFRIIWKLKFIFIPIIICLTFFYIIPRIEDSANSFGNDAGAYYYRLIQIRDSTELVKLHPFLGVGALMGVYEGITLDLYTLEASVPLQVHNWYLLVALEEGLLALFSFVFFILLSARKILYVRKKLQPEQIAILSIMVASLVIGIFQPYINIEFTILLLSLSNSVIIGS